MCLVEYERREEVSSHPEPVARVEVQEEEGLCLERIPVQTSRIAITTHARGQFVKRFPAPQAPKDLDEYLRANVRESVFLRYGSKYGTARYGNKYWEFVLALNFFHSGAFEVVVISCWGTGSSDFKNKKRKAMVYRRTRENRRWREECLA